MTNVKYLSFDLWLTLIQSDPLFKQKRVEFLADCYNPNGITSLEIERRVKLVDKLCDRFNELNDGKIPAEIMYNQVLLSLGNSLEAISNDLLVDIKDTINGIFESYPPLFLNSGIPDMLHQLKNDGLGINLSSNTGYIEGDCLVRVLDKLGIYDCFDFCIFSDQINSSKPSRVFYTKVLENRSGIRKSELLHIGDNSTTDYKGALDFGFKAFLITNSQYSIDDIRNAIGQTKD